MRIENGILIMELKPCLWCQGSLRVNEWVSCAACRGTGKKDPLRPKGRNCPVCGKYGSSLTRGQVLSIGTKACECVQSAHPGQEMEDRGSSCMPEIWQSLSFRVYRSDRHQTFAENLLGCGVYSCTDYGRHKSQTDEELIAHVRDGSSFHQASKFTDPQMRVCDHIGIFCNHSGYTVQAVYGADEAVAIIDDLKHSLPAQAGMMIGAKLAGEGYNGTMLAALLRR